MKHSVNTGNINLYTQNNGVYKEIAPESVSIKLKMMVKHLHLL